jgi:hypothetical protein
LAFAAQLDLHKRIAGFITRKSAPILIASAASFGTRVCLPELRY